MLRRCDESCAGCAGCAAKKQESPAVMLVFSNISEALGFLAVRSLTLNPMFKKFW